MHLASIEFVERSDWPPLAWCASHNEQSGQWSVEHGSRVELCTNWFGEIIWNGAFDAADFDQTDVVYGTAGKFLGGDEVVFVSPSSVLDRLVYLHRKDTAIISNSLVCLMAVTDAKVDALYTQYFTDFQSIIHGLDEYKRTLATSAGEINLIYFNNVRWVNGQFQVEPKPLPARQRDSFHAYETFLEEELCKLADNMSAPRRKLRWSLLGTTSTGFDSTTVSAIARKAGLQRVLAMDTARGGGNDCGVEIATALGLEAEIVERNGWRNGDSTEIPFLAADAKGEDVYFSSAEKLLKDKVVLTGFCGSIWGGHSEDYIKLKRTDQSGLSLTEYRLWAGFINVPVPGLGVYEARDLFELINSDESAQWSRGSSYDKPFCRSVLTRAGVPEDLYGTEKKAASVLLHDRESFLSDASRRDFQRFRQAALKRSSFTMWAKKCTANLASRLCRMIARAVMVTTQAISGFTRLDLVRRLATSVRLSEYAAGEPHFNYLFPWAIERAKQRYKPSKNQESTAAKY